MTGQGLLDLQNDIKDTLSKTIEDEGSVDKKEIIEKELWFKIVQ